MKTNRKNFIRQKQMRRETIRAMLDRIAVNIDTKRRIMETTGFSWGSVSTLVSELLAKKIIVKKANCTDCRTCHYAISRKNYYALGASIEDNCIDFSLISADGTLLERKNLPLKHAIDNGNAIDILADAFEFYFANSSFDRKKIIAAVLSLTGAVDTDKNAWIFSPAHPKIDHCDLGRLNEFFRCGLKTEHDIFSKARSIFFHHDIKDKKAVFLHIGKGIGLASCGGDGFFTGSRGFSGEIGHIPYHNGKDMICRCGKTNCLECSLNSGIVQKNGTGAIRKPFEFLTVTAVNLFDPELLAVGGEAVEKMLADDPQKWQDTIRNSAWMDAPHEFLFYQMTDCITSYGAALGCRSSMLDMISAYASE